MVKEASGMTTAKKNMYDVILDLEDIEAASVIAELAEVKVISQNSCKTATKYSVDQKYDNLDSSAWDYKVSPAMQGTESLEKPSEEYRQICKDTIGLIRRCRQVKGDFDDTLLSISHFEKKYAGAFKRCIDFLKDLKYIECRDKNSAKVSFHFRNLISLELYLMQKFGVEPAELPELDPNRSPVVLKSSQQQLSNEFPRNTQNFEYPVFFPGPLPIVTENVTSTDGSNGIGSFYRKNVDVGDVGIVPFIAVAGDCRTNGNMSLLPLTSPTYIVYNTMNSCEANQMPYHLNYGQRPGAPYLTSEFLYMPCSKSKEDFSAEVKSTGVTGIELAPSEKSSEDSAKVPSLNLVRKQVESTSKSDKTGAKSRNSSGNKQVQQDFLDKTSSKKKTKTVEATESHTVQKKRLYEEQKSTSQHDINDPMSLDEPSISSSRTPNSTHRPAKKTRLTVSVEERDILEQFYNQNQYPSRHRYNEIRKIMGWSSSRRITKWFNNRRYNTKQKRKS
ncbi:uncharacterized protein LOC126317081 [Schistocerca gregaria]|uniref:uncharacterized protein LOC126317081 n=1 Tax=Schistocerca gregaria TaxID=7010 RepID=UPI00211EF2F8|nr:uncharacterized protein LOC126317081 [Schistocerca gregaria]XP_049849015.1 uncharacterized protein LOC126317081 [Schistocerca gregaria]